MAGLNGVDRIPVYGRADQGDEIVAWALANSYHRLTRWTWRLNHEGYVFRHSNGDKILMHRQVLGLRRNDGVMADHINRCRTDNRDCNLRRATAAINAQNKGPKRGSKSGIRGVSWCNTSGSWKAGVRVNGRQHNAGTFHDLEAARVAVEGLRRRLMPHAN